MKPTPCVRTQRRGANDEILYIIFSNERNLNALTTDMQKQFIRLVAEAQKDKTVRAVVVLGEGDRAFSAGGAMESLKELQTEAACEAMYRRGVEIRETIAAMDKPIVAAVSGYCIGGGFEIAMCCDMIYASEDASFGLTEVDLGLVPGWGGAIRLPRKITVNKAKEMILLGERISAQEAAVQGIVNRVFPKEELFTEVDRIVDKLAAKPPLAIRGIKAIVSHGIVDGNVEVAQEVEHKLSVWLMSTHDFQGAVDAFREKRQPRFEGR